MSDELQSTSCSHWTESLGWPFIVKSLALAVRPSAWCLGAATIVLVVVWGGLLDVVWSPRGGVGEGAVDQMILAGASGEDYVEPEGDLGIFEVFRAVQARSLSGALSLSCAGDGFGRPPRTRMGHVVAMAQGTRWMVRCHPLYSVFFFGGALVICSVLGGAICRMAAVQLTRDERLTATEAIEYVKARLFTGFVLAPCIPLVLLGVAAVLLGLGGVVLGIPVLGDLLGGIAFPLAILGGGVMTALLLGLVLGGSLLWPAVAVDGADSFDAFSRSVSYVFTRPWKTAVYVLGTVVFGAVCWWCVRWAVFATLSFTRAFAGFGTAPFGWWGQGADGANKLERIWRLAGPDSLHAWPDWSQLAWYESVSAALIGLVVLLTISFVWGFLASFYFSGSTAIYILLRRDVDATDVGDLYEDDDGLDEPAPEAIGRAGDGPDATGDAASDKPPSEPTPDNPGENEST